LPRLQYSTSVQAGSLAKLIATGIGRREREREQEKVEWLGSVDINQALAVAGNWLKHLSGPSSNKTPQLPTTCFAKPSCPNERRE